VTRRTPATASRLGFSLALALVAALLGGCPEDHVPVNPDGAPPGDGTIILPGTDRDMDWACDNTELLRDTSTDSQDTDNDTFSDFAEIAYAYDPLLPASPPRDAIVLLRESPDASVQVTIEQIINAEGESFQGGVESLMARDLAGLTSAAFFRGTSALVANPPENVSAVIEDEARFLNVRGRTLLVFEARFAFGDQTPRSCIRGYPFRYTIKREDGRFVGSRRLLLVILPNDGTDVNAANWCMPAGGCV
jgi:hypothetical protein